MKIVGVIAAMAGIGLIVIGHLWPGVWALVIGIIMVLLNSKMSET